MPLPTRPDEGGDMVSPAAIFIKGHHYWPAIGDVGSDNFVVSADRLYALPMTIGRSTSFGGSVIEVAVAAAGNARLGVYRDAAGIPGALIVEDPLQIPTNIVAVMERSFNTPVLLSDAVWLAVVFSAAPTMRSFGVTGRAFAQGRLGTLGSSPAAQIDLIGGFWVPFPYAALPAAFPMGGVQYMPASFLPRIGLKC